MNSGLFQYKSRLGLRPFRKRVHGNRLNACKDGILIRAGVDDLYALRLGARDSQKAFAHTVMEFNLLALDAEIRCYIIGRVVAGQFV